MYNICKPHFPPPSVRIAVSWLSVQLLPRPYSNCRSHHLHLFSYPVSWISLYFLVKMLSGSSSNLRLKNCLFVLYCHQPDMIHLSACLKAFDHIINPLSFTF